MKKLIAIALSLAVVSTSALADSIDDLKAFANQQTLSLNHLDSSAKFLEDYDKAIDTQIANLKAINDYTQSMLNYHGPRASAVSEKAKFLSRVGNTIFVTGANLQVRHSSNASAAVNGLGNVIIGYNEVMDAEFRGGSNNLIIGSGHEWKASSNLIAGYQNSAYGTYNSILSGMGHMAWYDQNVIVTGTENRTLGKRGFILSGHGGSVWDMSLTLTGSFSESHGSGTVIVTGYRNYARGSQSVLISGYDSGVVGLGSSTGVGLDSYNDDDWDFDNY